MHLNYTAGELAGPRHDDLTREQFAGRILRALESVQAETRDATLREAADAVDNGTMRDNPASTIRALIAAPAPPDPATADDEYPSEPDEYTLGHVIWHTSEEGGGPDVGISIGMGGGKSLWIGEITSRRHKDGGESVAALGDDSGWWLMIYPDCMPIAKFADVYVAREFSEQIEGLAHKAAVSIKPVPPDPLLVALARVDFYEREFYPLSNFSAFRLEWEGLIFDTSEAAYHWEKFRGNAGAQAQILFAPSAHEAFKIAERRKSERRPDWDGVKVPVMLELLRAKADQHEYVRRKLLETGNRQLIECSWRDDFWGLGPRQDGQNMLGKLWMQVRTDLRAAIALAEGSR